MDFNKKICIYLFMYLFIYVFVCNVRIGVCGFVAVTSIFFCQMHCMLLTILAAFLGKHRKRCSQTAQYYICSYLLAAQLFSYYLCTQSMWTGNIWWRFSPFVVTQSIILLLGGPSERDFVAHAEFLFRSCGTQRQLAGSPCRSFPV